MAEVNDLFIRSLRKSTRRQLPERVPTSSPPDHNHPTPPFRATSSPQTAPAWLTGRHSARGGDSPTLMAANSTTPSRPSARPEDRAPPDLLANLSPSRHHPDERCSSRTSSSSTTCSSPVSSVVSPSTAKTWNPFASMRKSSSPPSQVVIVKEYQVQHCVAAKSRRGSGAAPTCLALNSPLLLESPPPRVVPAWFAPAQITRLTVVRRQDSFHGETAASRLLSAKQRAFRFSGRSGGNSSNNNHPQRESIAMENCGDNGDRERDVMTVSYAQTIAEEPERTAGVAGKREV